MKFFLTFLLFIIPALAIELITPIPEQIPYDKEKAILGKKLYMDTSLSKDKKVSCNSCHDLNSFGVDNKTFSTGINGIVDEPFHTPTNFNAVFNLSQFWRGNAKDLKEQAKHPLLNPKEMGLSNENEVIEIVKSNPHYKKEFEKLYGEVSFDNIADSLAEFQKTLLTPNSPFDRYLKGDKNAISEQAKRGYEAFVSNGCIACHQGQNIGGNMYQKMGVFVPYDNGTNWQGRFEITKDPNDKFVVKVPSLRNIAKTAPYFHDGSMPTLDACVQFMAYYQLGKFLEQDVVDDIVAFLNSLTGEYHDPLK
ncbi:cytochrome c551 peroxidase [Campylobacter peloridis]|uniref:Cytochrome c551 peroxidase n=1 Tax=Campylobacter peloridis TaxID=488546 RepID=A0ABX6TUB2_9BACT|nr:cytochrome c551 peroxidase [Campylobacter peloridis]AJC83963.1 cytochrome c peroxidase [Campylobacter peloridis LMG 23910]QOQ89556.1 cytochrome c551 peroxidase [Campylobacter peloridis]